LNTLKQFDLEYLKNGYNLLAGIDEAGRGPLAGPVVAAAVIFKKDTFIEGVNDSKKITSKQREVLSELIKKQSLSYAFGIVNHKTIDRINILQATLKAMKTAFNKLDENVDLILIDGNKSFVSSVPIKTIIKGDSKSFSIAAASILAKVKRDEIMRKASLKFPQYFWETNKGYGTKQHIEAIKKHGYTQLHRISFLTKILNEEIQGEFLNE
jgi:ribonuclease HII